MPIRKYPNGTQDKIVGKVRASEFPRGVDVGQPPKPPTPTPNGAPNAFRTVAINVDVRLALFFRVKLSVIILVSELRVDARAFWAKPPR